MHFFEPQNVSAYVNEKPIDTQRVSKDNDRARETVTCAGISGIK